MLQLRDYQLETIEKIQQSMHNSIFHIDFMGDGDEVITPEQQDKYKEQLAKLDRLTHINHKEKAND